MQRLDWKTQIVCPMFDCPIGDIWASSTWKSSEVDRKLIRNSKLWCMGHVRNEKNYQHKLIYQQYLPWQFCDKAK